ncbi:MAG: pantetheine-phosphate adenylyltransferase [Thermomicrobiales bacterium]
MTVAIFPGTFDPITNGHVDVALRAARLFDKVIIGVNDAGDRSSKKPLFTADERVVLAAEALAHAPNIVVDRWDGLLVEYAHRVGAQAIIRGLRAVSDFEYELGMAHVNHTLNDAVETVFLMTSSAYSFIHANLIREVALLGGDVSGLVPPHVSRALREKVAPLR